MASRTKMILAATLTTLAFSTGAFAQTASTTTSVAIPDHPRVNEVEKRLDKQQERVDAGVANGTINAKEEARIDKRDAKVSSEMAASQAEHDGHITKPEQHKMNRQLRRNNAAIHRAKTN